MGGDGDLLGGVVVLVIEPIRWVREVQVTPGREHQVIGAVESLALEVGRDGGEGAVLLHPVTHRGKKRTKPD